MATLVLGLMNSIVSTFYIVVDSSHGHQATTAKAAALTALDDVHSPLEENVKTTTKKKEAQLFHIDMTNYTGPARAFPIFPHPFPCFPEWNKPLMNLKPADTGFLFHRPQKTGSTSMSSITMRIANRKATQQLQLLSQQGQQLELPKNGTLVFCKHRAMHGSAVFYEYAKRDRTKSFLFTMVRNPTKRIISSLFHFLVSAHNFEPTDAIFQYHLNTDVFPSPLLNDASLVPTILNHTRVVPESFNYTDVVEQVLDGYDFIMVTERYDESLVALKMILNLDFEDILYTRERSEGTFTNGFPGRPCFYIVPSFLTPGMKNFYLSEHWTNFIKGDNLLYQAAYKSLDLTIDRLGRAEFTKQLEYFQTVNQKAQAICAPREMGLCDEGGAVVPKENRTCFIWSEGCSHACLDEIQLNELTTMTTRP